MSHLLGRQRGDRGLLDVTYLVPHSTGIEDVVLNKRRRQVAADALVAYSRKGAFDDEEEPVRPEALIS